MANTLDSLREIWTVFYEQATKNFEDEDKRIINKGLESKKIKVIKEQQTEADRRGHLRKYKGLLNVHAMITILRSKRTNYGVVSDFFGRLNVLYDDDEKKYLSEILEYLKKSGKDDQSPEYKLFDSVIEDQFVDFIDLRQLYDKITSIFFDQNDENKILILDCLNKKQIPHSTEKQITLDFLYLDSLIVITNNYYNMEIDEGDLRMKRLKRKDQTSVLDNCFQDIHEMVNLYTYGKKMREEDTGKADPVKKAFDLSPDDEIIINSKEQLEFIDEIGTPSEIPGLFKCTIHRAVITDYKKRVVVKEYGFRGREMLEVFQKEFEYIKELSGAKNLFLKYYGQYMPSPEEIERKLKQGKKDIVMGVAMEECGNNLFSEMVESGRGKRKHDIHQIQNIIFQLIDGFQYMGSRKIDHLDIKPQNILIGHDNFLKIIDFNVARRFDNPTKSVTVEADTNIGTAGYTPPEIAAPGNMYKAYYSRVDSFSLGMTILEIYFRRPMSGLNTYESVEDLKRIIMTIEEPWISEMLLKMTHVNPKKRPKMKQLTVFLPNHQVTSQDYQEKS